MRRVAFLGILLTCASVFAVKPKERPVKQSPYRTYFWGARDAFERREFDKAASLLATYKRLGSPRDRLVQANGCGAGDEVKDFSDLLKATRQCIQDKKRSDPAWANFEVAKREIHRAFEEGNADALLPYVGCAPSDLTFDNEFCPASGHATPERLRALVALVHETRDIHRRFIWRDRRVAPGDEVSPRWVLTTTSEHWHPHGLPNAFLMTLRQDKKGRIRIAGFAATLE